MAIDTSFGKKAHLIHLQSMLMDALDKLNLLGDHNLPDNYKSFQTVGSTRTSHGGLITEFNLNGWELAHFYMDMIENLLEDLVVCPSCGKSMHVWKRKSWEDYLWTGFNCEDECIDADEMGFSFSRGIFDYTDSENGKTEIKIIFSLEGYKPFMDEVERLEKIEDEERKKRLAKDK
jgi:hypothetical protein